MHFLNPNNLCLLFFIFLVFLNPVFADIWDKPSEFQNIISQIPDLKSIKCKFKQEKIIPNIKTPVVSSGNFEFIENEGVYFYINYPIQTTIDYTNKNYKQINDIIKAISSKNYEKLSKNFDFYFDNSQNKQNWIIGLKPKTNLRTADFLEFVIIEGNSYINKIKINLINGSATTIWFEK